MKNFLLITVSSTLLFLDIFSVESEVCAQREVKSYPQETILYEWEIANETESIRTIFLNSFLQNYHKLGLTLEDLATDDIEQVLNGYWESELENLKNNQLRWIVAKVRGEIVGYASFNMDNAPEEVVVQLLCVKPEYQGLRIGKNLLFSIFQIEEKIGKLSLVTRRLNSSAIAFYKNLGFEENAFVDKKANIDKSLCIQLERLF